MAKDERLEIQWATFRTAVRLSAQSGAVQAVVRSEVTRLSFGLIFGQPFLIVEEVAPPPPAPQRTLPHPATVPWHSVTSVGWVTPPPIDSATPKEKVLK